jgi:hypothetical protein
MIDPNQVPDLATDPVTGPVVDRLERFLAANTIQPPEDLALRVRERLALEPRPSTPRRLTGAFHRDADAAVGRRSAGLPVWLRVAALIAILVVAGGVVGLAGVQLLRSAADRVGGPGASPTVSPASPSPSVAVPEATIPPVATPATSATRASTRGDAAQADWPAATHATLPARSQGTIGVAAMSSPEPTPVVTAEPTAELTPEPTPVVTAEPTPVVTAEPTAEPTPEPTRRPSPTPHPTAEATERPPDLTQRPTTEPDPTEPPSSSPDAG